MIDQQQNGTDDVPIVTFESRSQLIRSSHTAKLSKRRIFRATPDSEVPVKEGIHLLEFFKDEKPKSATKIKLSNQQQQQQQQQNYKAKTHKFRAEVLYYPIIHGDLRRTEMQIKYRLPNKQDIELEREAVVYRDMYHGKRVFVPPLARTSKEATLLYKNYSKYDKYEKNVPL